MENRQEFIAELARIFGQQPEAEALLEETQYPRAVVPNWQAFQNATRYWARVLTDIENGRLPEGGPERLAAAARDQFPQNRIFRAAAEHEPEPLPETRVTTTPGPGDQTGPQRIEEWPTLVFQGSDHYDAFVRLVREVVGPQAQLLYATGEQAAVLVAGIGADGTDPAELVARLQRAVDQLDLPEETQVEVRFERYAYRPHLIEQLRLIGPDQQVFYADNIPNTTPVRDIPHALFAEYREQTQTDRLGRGRRAVVDRVRPAQTPGGQPQQDRLNPDQSLEEAGVTEGDELHVRPESTAGAVDQVRLDALKRVRNEIEEFAEENASGFLIVDKDDPYLPTVYQIEFSAPGFGPPEDMSGSPDEYKPTERETHRVFIILGPEFPFKAPWVVFGSPIFHPNVLAERQEQTPAGWVCIGALGDAAYRPDLDFYELCQLIIDIAAYRNYGAIPHGILGAHGFLNRPAAEWAISDAGQEQITARGGRPILSLLGIEEQPPQGKLRIRRASGTGHDA
jgi:ubiquitin-protein ligase